MRKVKTTQILGPGRLSEISRNIIDIGIGMIRSYELELCKRPFAKVGLYFGVHRVSAGSPGAKMD